MIAHWFTKTERKVIVIVSIVGLVVEVAVVGLTGHL